MKILPNKCSYAMNDKVKRTAIIKPTNKLNINKYFLTIESKVKTVMKR